jgi:branched-chain amino acid transport system ATP-binding protein
MIEVRQIDVFYGKIQALRKVSLVVNRAELVAIIGANGAGKSTLIKSMTGIVPKSGGDVYFEGQRITHTPCCKMIELGIAVIPEGRRLFGPMSVMDNLLLGAYTRLKGNNKIAVHADLEKVFDLFPRLKERYRQSAGSLSGGEQQMLAIGRALMASPRVILLDEPSLGLAPLLVKEIFSTLTHLKEGGLAIMLIEQNARMALNICDRAYVLEVGNVMLQGTGCDLLQNQSIKESYLGS